MSIPAMHRQFRLLLWTAFGLILTAGGMLLVFACDFAKPPLLDFGRRFCPAPVNAQALNQGTARQHELQSRIHDAEIQLARIPDCAQSDPQPTAKPSQPPERQAQGPTVGKQGRLQITLWWHTIDDLDLHVNCPGGQISPFDRTSKGPGICGDGHLDVDANRNMVSPVDNPAEHVYWQNDIPTGSYSVFVRPAKTASATKIPYSVRIDFDGEQKICTGEVMWDETQGSGYGQIAIEFNPEHPLPDCLTMSTNLVVCQGPACRYQRKP